MNSLDVSPDSLLIQYRLSLEASNKSQKTIKWYLPGASKMVPFLYFSALNLNA